MSNYQNTALMVMDIQEMMMKRLPNPKPLLNNISKAIQAARNENIPVIYVQVKFREKYPEISDNGLRFSQIKNAGNGGFTDNDPDVGIHPQIAPLPTDIVVTKKRFSAFTGNDLELILRSGGIKRLILAGFSTSGVVLSTVREAFDKDYLQTVLSDSCADASQEVHEFLISKILPMQASVISTGEWVESIANLTN